MLLFFYGSHPKISLLELKSLSFYNVHSHYYGADVDMPLPEGIALFNKLGGFPRVGNILGEYDEKQKNEIIKRIALFFSQRAIKKYVVSFFGGAERMFKTGDIMHALKSEGIKAKYSGKLHEKYASPASVYYLTRRNGVEFCIVQEKKKVYLCETVAVQDPNYWSLIDFERPHRDKHIGMLPSKLARIMVNLSKAQPNELIWDPFVGQGTIAMQANLLNMQVLGTDKNPVAVQFSEENMNWLLSRGLIPNKKTEFFEWDIMASETTQFAERNINGIVTETFLGAMRSRPFENADEAGRVWQREVQPLLQRLLSISENVLQKGQRIVFVKPIYKYIDKKTVKWYNPEIRFNRSIWQRVQTSDTFEDNIWIQKDSTIGREIVVLEKLAK